MKEENTKKKFKNFIKLFSKPEKEEPKRSILPKFSSFKKKKLVRKKLRNKKILNTFMRKAGFEDVDERIFSKKVFKAAIIITAILTIILISVLIKNQMSFLKIIYFLVILWTLGLVLVLAFSWIFIHVYLDIRIFQRTLVLENVLPDFLQLASTNMSAGMTVDQALWFAVRPQFGVLAKEIESVAKSTIAGDDLSEALLDFSNKYDSKVLKRSVSLLIEGMRAGGKMADLLTKIAVNIQESKLMKQEMAANIMTYAIFIGFATVVAAPFLFALSTQLLQVVGDIMGSVDLSSNTGSFSMKMSGDSISIVDFQIFSVIMLIVSGFFSACIVSIIRKGNVKEGVKLIPVFIIVSLILYFIASKLLSSVMGGFF
ncbi:MAG: type II secretion system F family protein [Nanoarchaeota archaeon]|nr:type II secretion system F family protein [Nanoarchaeota archaeon]MBU1029606.1 type II secretion system F family protein [Nanoarchaeota archaeon]MBU1850242.1 type II secretion system F family protein [Nanoarchaeota archaeon]